MKIRFRTMQVVASLFTLLLAVTTVNAQGDSSPVLQRIAKTKILRVGMTGEQPPFNVKNRDGKLIGVDVDYAPTGQFTGPFRAHRVWVTSLWLRPSQE